MYSGRNNLYDAAIRRMVKESLEQKHQEFARNHELDTDQQLLDYLKSESERLGHPPHRGEILGWELIASRFGGWPEALAAAGLAFPNVPNDPERFLLYLQEEQIQKKEYTRRKAEKKRAAALREAQRNKVRRQGQQRNRKKTENEPTNAEDTP